MTYAQSVLRYENKWYNIMHTRNVAKIILQDYENYEETIKVFEQPNLIYNELRR